MNQSNFLSFSGDLIGITPSSAHEVERNSITSQGFYAISNFWLSSDEIVLSKQEVFDHG